MKTRLLVRRQGRSWKILIKSHFLFDPDNGVDVPRIQVAESGKYDLYAINICAKYAPRLF